MSVSQDRYIYEILDRFHMTDCKPASTPFPTGTVLTKEMAPANDEEKMEMKKKPYQELIGSLMYLTTSTRPDLAYSVGVLCRFMSNPGIQHWNAAKHVLRYLRHTAELGLTFTASRNGNIGDPKLHGFCDSDYAGCVDSRKSTTGYVFFLDQSTISWSSGLQPLLPHHQRMPNILPYVLRHKNPCI